MVDIVDFKNAFDSVHRESFGQLMYSIQNKYIINIFKLSY